MKAALIPTDDGGRVIAWTCHGSKQCNGGCARVSRSEGRGEPEAVALSHATKFDVGHGRVHTVNSGCRGQTFKVWRTGLGYQAREVL